MNTQLFRLELGVLLDQTDEEFEYYNQVYTKNYGFYDENVIVYLDYKKAIKYANEYVNSSVDKTYAIITSAVANITKKDKNEIKNTGSFDASDIFGYNENDIEYFIYQSANRIKTVINKISKPEIIPSGVGLRKTNYENLYTKTGEPKRIRCYMIKSEPKPADYITVVYTYASKAGFLKGSVQYRAMSGKPFHPLGYAQWGEGWQWNFRPGGSRIKFSDLPKDCQELVIRDYKEIWEKSNNN